MKIPEDIASRYTNKDQKKRFDKAVDKMFSLSPARAEEIREQAPVTPTKRGRQPKGTIPANRIPVKIELD